MESTGPYHWTYSEVDKSALFQGDVISKSDGLLKLLKNVHPYFYTSTRYVAFQLITQSCDLVRRNGKCKAPYLTIAAVREIVDIFEEKELRKISKLGVGQLVEDSARTRVNNFLTSTINNNNPNYFFLRGDNNQGILSDCLACLRVTVPLRSEHYDLLLEAKVGQLKDVFQAKLGWLVGNNYSRVGTPDWTGSKRDKRKQTEIVEALTDRITFLSDSRLKQAIKVLENEEKEITAENLEAYLESHEGKELTRRNLFDRAISAVWPEGTAAPARSKLLGKLRQNPDFLRSIRDGR